MEFSNNQNLCKKETITLHLPFKVAEIRHAGKTVKKTTGSEKLRNTTTAPKTRTFD